MFNLKFNAMKQKQEFHEIFSAIENIDEQLNSQELSLLKEVLMRL